MSKGAGVDAPQPQVSGLAAVMTVIAMGLGYAIAIGDPTSLSANLQIVSSGLHITGTTATFVASLATLAMAAAVATPLPAVSGALAHAFSWRACFFAVAVIATVGLVITWRYVPETVQATRRLDLIGMALFAVALPGFIFGISHIWSTPNRLDW